MSERRQKMRGTTVQHASYAGNAGQITVDTTKQTVVVQDGSQNGGYPLAREAIETFAPTRGTMHGAYQIGDLNWPALRVASFGTAGRTFSALDAGCPWRGANFVDALTPIGLTSFGSSGGTSGYAATGGANLIDRIGGYNFAPNAGTAGGLRQNNTNTAEFLGNGTLGGFHLHMRLGLNHSSANTADSFYGLKKTSALVNGNLVTASADIIGFGTSSSHPSGAQRLLVVSGGGGSAANNTSFDTGIDLALNDVLELELLSLPTEDRKVHWRYRKLNTQDEDFGTIVGAGNNLPASTDTMYIHMQRYSASVNASWRAYAAWVRTFHELGEF